MNKRDFIISELDSVSDNILDEVIDFVQFLKYKKSKSESLKKETLELSISKYKGIAKGIWDKDAQEIIDEIRDNDR